MNCFIEFDITESKNFDDLKRIFNILRVVNANSEKKSDDFWLNIFPDYSLSNFSFLDIDVKPDFETADYNKPFIWHFYSLIVLLSKDYSINYENCFKLTERKGRLEYLPWEYPYGGITGLIVFIRSFNCIPKLIDDGTSLYAIDFLDNGDFSITDLNDPKRQNSAIKLFSSTKLLWEFAKRINKN